MEYFYPSPILLVGKRWRWVKFHSLNDPFHKIVHHQGKSWEHKSLATIHDSARSQSKYIHCKIFFQPRIDVTLLCHVSTHHSERYIFDDEKRKKRRVAIEWQRVHRYRFRSWTFFFFFLFPFHFRIPVSHIIPPAPSRSRGTSNGWESRNF